MPENEQKKKIRQTNNLKKTEQLRWRRIIPFDLTIPVSGLTIHNLLMFYVSCIPWNLLETFFLCWYLKCKVHRVNHFLFPFWFGDTQAHVSVKVILVHTIRIYLLPVISNIYLIFAVSMNVSGRKLTYSNPCRNKYKKLHST